METLDSREKSPPPLEKMPGHWLLASLGKRVLRPGGLELTRHLLSFLAIGPDDDVVEFAPGVGITARMALARRPKWYVAVEREPQAAAEVARYLTGPNQRCIIGTAEATGLPAESASIVYGEAMLSMQPAAVKAHIVAEATRLLRSGGRYGIHELCLTPDDLDPGIRESIEREMSDEIHVGVRPLSAPEWCELLTTAGLTVTAKYFGPMHLLEPTRLVRDEGLLRSIRFVWNMAINGPARRRVLAMRRIFRKYQENLVAVALVCTKP